MKRLKIYEYEIDGFMKGRFMTYAPHRVRRHIRSLIGFINYMRIRKYLTIKEVKEDVE
jgi:hypothetical protein